MAAGIRFPAVRLLNQVAGLQDAFVDMTEMALCHLVDEAHRAPEGISEFGEGLRRRFRIRSNFVELEPVLQNARRFYIVQTHLAVEAFLDQAIKESQLFGPVTEFRWQLNGEQLDSLSALTANLPRDASKAVRDAPEYDILQYYRLVRNSIIHPEERSERKLGAECERLRTEHATYLHRHFSQVAAPNRPADLSYDDFRLYTHSARRFAHKLTHAIDPSPERIGAYLLTNAVTFSHVRKLKSSRVKLRRWLDAYGKEFALTTAEGDRLFAIISEHLASDPSHRERRRKGRRQSP